jgi:hypothetical protein
MNQPSIFRFLFFDSARVQIGALTVPDVAVATNSDLKGIYPNGWTKDTRLEVDGETYTLEFEYLNRDWVNDLEYRLMHEGTLVASSTYHHKPGKRLMLEQPFQAELVSKGGIFAARFELVADGASIGAVFERGFMVMRRLWIDLPDAVPRPVQCFLAYLVFLRAFK